ncbi:PAS domain S-box protein [Flavobacterium sp. N3904]|uniref:PAS domain S-box protein n=1 Tax=Flavobacterium sp. N3904 TaxID=2986835 RepID=UPI002224B853|nr:PAS domain S-box protein [Flavobacterium sp. N3904]
MIGKKTLLEFFKISPTPSLLLQIDSPKFSIADVNDAFLEATHSQREDLIGKGIFEVFPANDSYNATDSEINLTLSSLNTVLKTHKKHQMAIQKYDIPIRGTSEFELKYWESENIPLFDDDEKLNLIAHCSRDVTKQIITEKQFKEFEYFFKNSNDFSCIANTEGYFEITNPSFNNAFGYSQNELEKEPFIDFVHPDDIADTLKVYDKLKSGATVIHFINRYRKKDGSYLFLDWSATPNPVTGKLYCIARDITEHKKAESDLSNLNEQLEQRVQERTAEVEKVLEENNVILESIGDAFFAVDKFWKVTYWNRIAERDLSVLKQDIVGKNLWEMFSDSIDSESYRKYHEAVATNQVVHFEDYYLALNKWYEISAYPSENGLSAYFKDVTENKKAKEIIKKSNERFEYVTKATFDAIWDWDLTDNKFYWGDGFEKIFGYNLTELKDDSDAWMKNIHPDDLEKITQSYYDTVKSNAINWIEEYRFKKNNGQYAYIINKGIVIRDTSGRATRIIGAMQDITKRKQEEVRLKLLESVITNTDDSILITEAEPFDQPGPRIIYVNDAFTKMTGYTADEVIGKTPRILQGPETDREELNKLGAAIRKWQPYEVTLLNYKKNGEEFWLHISINPVADATGWFTHWIAIERDVTQQKREEERLKLLESVITNTNDAVVIKEAKPLSELGRKIVYVNESFTRMSGYTSDEIIGRTHKLLQGPNTNEEELVRFYKALDEGQPCEIEIINYNKNGKEYWVNLSLNPVTNSKGEYTHWISIERDVTERKNQEKKLKETTQRLLDTIESIQDGFYTLDSNWNVSYWNIEAERISGKTKEEMIGKNFWELYDGRISEKINTAFHKAKSNNKPIRFEVYSKQSKYWFELNAFPSELGLTVYFKNITERKHTESKLKKINRSLENHVKELAISNQELEQFAYVASHDLQEPLRMITSFLTQIEKKYGDVLDEKGKKYIFFAVDGAKRMRQIILDLLEFSRIGKNENRHEKVDLNSIVEEIILLYRKQIEEKKAIINYEALPILHSYAVPLRQVFQNLISNSLKYSKPDSAPVVSIYCSESAAFWKFEIKDNGIGINSEYYDKIFIIFQRLHSKEEYSGTGMGLAITKKIIENLRGEIWVKSEEGKGTSFYFTIPKK